MTERPILFSGAMVRAILAGRKTQTRRILCGRGDLVEVRGKLFDPRYEHHRVALLERCPYGRACEGDRLWVKETWRPTIAHGCVPGACDCADVIVRYEAGGDEAYFRDGSVPDEWTMPKAARSGNVSPLYMPRWASRLTLEITSVRVEWLQDISEEDARAEGCWVDGPCDDQARDVFVDLWDGINGKRAPWSSNPWVWVIAFRSLAAEEPKCGFPGCTQPPRWRGLCECHYAETEVSNGRG